MTWWLLWDVLGALAAGAFGWIITYRREARVEREWAAVGLERRGSLALVISNAVVFAAAGFALVNAFTML